MVKWTPKSEKDLEEILEYISENFNTDKAMSIVFSLVDYIESTLIKNPLAGKLLESSPLFSKLIYEGNSIYYCENPQDKHLYIVYVQPRKTKLKLSRISKEEVA